VGFDKYYVPTIVLSVSSRILSN